jgi:hypothetical protein
MFSQVTVIPVFLGMVCVLHTTFQYTILFVPRELCLLILTFVGILVAVCRRFVLNLKLGVCPCVATGVRWDEHRHISDRILYFLGVWRKLKLAPIDLFWLCLGRVITAPPTGGWPQASRYYLSHPMVVVHAGTAEVGRSWGRRAHLLEEAITVGGEGDKETLHICDIK